MKKTKVLIMTAVLLTFVLAAGTLLAGCDVMKNPVRAPVHTLSELIPKANEKIATLSEHTAIEGYTLKTNGSGRIQIDDFGLVIASKTADVDGTPETTYKLYDLVNKKVCAETKNTPITKISDGLYNVKEETMTAEGDTVITTTFYGKNDPHVNTKDTPDIDSDIVTLKDGSRLYVDVNGDLKIETEQLKFIMSYNMINEDDFYKLDLSDKDGARDVRFSFDEGVLHIADITAGKPKIVNLNTVFGVSGNSEPQMFWNIGEKVFVQYKTALPFDATIYDVYDKTSSEKYNVDTFGYDILTGVGSKLDNFNFRVADVEYAGKEFAVLNGLYFEAGSLKANEMIQTFDKNGTVFVDLQKIMPGMIYIDFTQRNGEIFCVDESFAFRIYQGDNLITENGVDIVTNYEIPFVITEKAAYGYDLKKICDFADGETFSETRHNTIITEKDVDGETIYKALSYDLAYGANGLEIKKSQTKENVIPFNDSHEFFFAAKTASENEFEIYDARYTSGQIGTVRADNFATDVKTYMIEIGKYAKTELFYGLTRDGEPVYYTADFTASEILYS